MTALAAGSDHSCAVADGKAYCWGNNSAGQLGDNTTTTSKVPVAVDATGPLAGRTVTGIAGGNLHSCAVADGKAYCWGNNSNGQLGDNTTTTSKVPVAVDTTGPLAGRTVTAITAGGFHSCAVAEGKAYCWGYNSNGQLGDNTTTTSKVPVAVTAAPGVLAGKTATALAAGYMHSCAVADGKAYCWGNNSAGQLGDNTTTTSKVPVAVDTTGPLAGRTVTSIAAGYWHSCVVAEGRASCWGYNNAGQLGNNSTTNATVPVAVDTTGPLAGRTVTAIAAGYWHSCAVADGRASCWGYNGDGQLGNDSTTDSAVPVAVNTGGPLAGKTITAITAGGYHSAVLAAAVPQPPTGVAALPGNGQVSLSWTPPADDGGSPVLDYVTTAIPGGSTCATTSTSCVVAGLANGTGYTFTVTARNAIGASAPSTPSAPVTPGGHHPAADHPGRPRQGDGGQGGRQEGQGEDHLEGGGRRHLLPGADLQTGRQEVQSLEDHHQTGVQSQGAQGQEVPLPSRCNRDWWPRAGRHRPVQRQVGHR